MADMKFTLRAVDVSYLGGIFIFVPWLGTQILEHNNFAFWFITPGFLIILIGILAIRSLPTYDKALDIVGMLGSFFFTIVFLMLFGYAANDSGKASDVEGYAVLGFFIYFPFVFVAFSVSVEKYREKAKAGPTASVIALLCVHYLTILGAAVWEAFTLLPSSPDPVYATGFPFLMLFLILCVLFMVFFGLPRIFLMLAYKDYVGFLIYLLGLGIYLWDKVPPVN